MGDHDWAGPEACSGEPPRVQRPDRGQQTPEVCCLDERLPAGNVFTESFIRGWIETKRENEWRVVAIRPHPYEYQLYLDT